jgi:hypothetical protein
MRLQLTASADGRYSATDPDGSAPLACGNQTQCGGVRPYRQALSLGNVGYAQSRPLGVSVAKRMGSVPGHTAAGAWSSSLIAVEETPVPPPQAKTAQRIADITLSCPSRGLAEGNRSRRTCRLSEYGLTQEEIFAAIDAGKLRVPARREAQERVTAAAPQRGRGPGQDLARRAIPGGYGRTARRPPRRGPRRRDRQPLRPGRRQDDVRAAAVAQAARARGPRSGDHHPAVDRECDACDERGFVRREEHDSG